MLGTLGRRPSKCIQNVATTLVTTNYQCPFSLQHDFDKNSADDLLPAFLMLPERVICGKRIEFGNDMLAYVQIFGDENMYKTK